MRRLSLGKPGKQSLQRLAILCHDQRLGLGVRCRRVKSSFGDDCCACNLLVSLKQVNRREV